MVLLRADVTANTAMTRRCSKRLSPVRPPGLSSSTPAAGNRGLAYRLPVAGEIIKSLDLALR